MEIQASFPYLRTLLSYECVDTVGVGDHVEVLEGTRRGMVGTVEVLQRGSYKGTLCKCRKTDATTDEYAESWSQDDVVKSRLSEPDVIARQAAERKLK
jgi:hypothetical protein